MRFGQIISSEDYIKKDNCSVNGIDRQEDPKRLRSIVSKHIPSKLFHNMKHLHIITD